MRDKISIERVKLLHPKISNEVAQLIDKVESNFPPTIAVRTVYTYRTFEQQNELYALGRTKVNPDGKSLKKPLGNIVTNAKAGQSYHNFALAFDFGILYDQDGNGSYELLSWDIKRDFDKDSMADWFEVIRVFEKAGYESGANWKSIKDYPHLQKTFGLSESQCLSKYNKKDFIPGTSYLRI